MPQHVLALEELGIPVEVHHHEVATAGQCEIGTKFSSLVERADWSQIFQICNAQYCTSLW